MHKYLICYGCDNEFFLCLAEDAAHAREQFESVQESGGFDGDINAIYRCIEEA